MAITLEQLIVNFKETENMTLVAGEKGLSKLVRWVHMVEGSSSTAFLEGNEVVFTTGIGAPTPETLLELVQQVCQQNATGIVLNIGPYISEVSAAIIDYANQQNFPVFTVPWDVHMAVLMQKFSRQLHLDEQKSMELEVAFKNSILYEKHVEMYEPVLINYGYKENWAYDVLAVDIRDKQFLTPKPDKVEKILLLSREQLHGRNNPVEVLYWNEEFIFIFSNSHERDIGEKMKRLLTLIEESILRDGFFFAGTGHTANGMSRIGRSYQQAHQVKELQKRRNRRNELMYYDNLGLYKLLMELNSRDALDAYVDEMLGDIERFDRVNLTDHLYFLKEYFRLECSVMDTAAKLNMHRNTVTYRIHKIEEITHKSLSEPMTRTELMVAFMAKELI